MLKVFTTFTGVGSTEMSWKNIKLDFEVVGISEVDRYALQAYDSIHNEQIDIEYPSKEEMLKEFKDKNIGYNFSTNKSEIPKNIDEIKHLYRSHKRSKNYGDIRLINEKELPDFDLFTYSFPCKNISVAGKQAGLEKGSETQSSLLWECERIIKEKRPKYLLMENVKNLVGKGHIEHFKEWISVLDAVGYNSYWKVLNGKNFGVPQNRERVMMISILKEYDNGYIMPKGQCIPKCISDILELNVDEKYYMNKPFKFVNKGHQAEFLTGKFEQSKRIYSENNSTFRTLEGANRGKYNILIEGQIIDMLYQNGRIYSKDGISCTLDSMNGGNRQPKIFTFKNTEKDVFSIDGKCVRKLTPLECWRLMGYKDEDFYKARDIGKLANTKLYERAGRGIVVPMLEELFKSLFKIK